MQGGWFRAGEASSCQFRVYVTPLKIRVHNSDLAQPKEIKDKHSNLFFLKDIDVLITPGSFFFLYPIPGDQHPSSDLVPYAISLPLFKQPCVFCVAEVPAVLTRVLDAILFW